MLTKGERFLYSQGGRAGQESRPLSNQAPGSGPIQASLLT